MSFMHQRSAAGLPPVLAGVMVCLDPRRWFGALLATAGVLASIVAPFVPAFIVKRAFPPAAGTIVSRPAATPRRPSLIYVQPIWATSEADFQPHSTNVDPSSPRVTFACDPHPYSATPSSLTESTTNSRASSADTTLKFSDVMVQSPSSSPSSLTQALPPESPYLHPHALPSMESLAPTSDTPVEIPPSSPPSAKRHFRVPLPRLTFGRRGSENAGNTGVPETATDSSGTPISDGEWRGTKTFAVKKANAQIGTHALAPEDPLSTFRRRKFSLFSRESPPTPSIKDGTSPPALQAVPLPLSQSIVPRVGEIIPDLPQSGPTVSPLSVTEPSLSADALPHTPRVVFEDMTPLALTTTPPSRPARTDPYKTYGVPVPGSDRARAFLKAEKQWIRAERERRARERIAREAGDEEVSREYAESGSGHGRGYDNENPVEKGGGGENENSRESTCKRPLESLKKHRDRVPEAASSVEPSEESHGGSDAAIVNVIPEKHPTHEVGVLPVLSAPSTALPDQTQNRPKSAHGKLGWIFSRRASDGVVEKEKDKHREKKVKAKEKPSMCKNKDHDDDDDSTKITMRSKSREGSKTSLSLRRKGRRKVKDRGYSSDTGVPSLTYKLMP